MKEKEKGGNLLYLQPETIEAVFKAIEDIVRRIRENDKNKLCCIVWDSIAVLLLKPKYKVNMVILL